MPSTTMEPRPCPKEMHQKACVRRAYRTVSSISSFSGPPVTSLGEDCAC